jgi:rhodanese-related sulfurtransferase
VFSRPSIPAVGVAELAALLAADPSTPVVDVREPDEYAAGHVPSAVLMPLHTVPVRHTEIPRDRTVYVVCAVGGRSGQAVAWLNEQGYDTVNVDGGTREWVMAGHPVE